jgi:hypothetical protein
MQLQLSEPSVGATAGTIARLCPTVQPSLLQGLQKCVVSNAAFWIVRREPASEPSDAPYALQLLRMRRERPCCRTAKEDNEFAPSHELASDRGPQSSTPPGEGEFGTTLAHAFQCRRTAEACQRFMQRSLGPQLIGCTVPGSSPNRERLTLSTWTSWPCISDRGRACSAAPAGKDHT